jgi:hypothetical protein
VCIWRKCARDRQNFYQRLNRAYKNGKNRKTRLKTNSLLTEEQDYSLLRYIDFIDDIGFGVHHDLVRQQCDTILATSHTGVGLPPHCGVHWAQRWLRQHSQFRRVKAKPIEAQRKLAQQPEVIQKWFDKLGAKIKELAITRENLYNMDECGVRIGVAKNQYVYTKYGKQVIILEFYYQLISNIVHRYLYLIQIIASRFL